MLPSGWYKHHLCLLSKIPICTTLPAADTHCAAFRMVQTSSLPPFKDSNLHHSSCGRHTLCCLQDGVNIIFASLQRFQFTPLFLRQTHIVLPSGWCKHHLCLPSKIPVYTTIPAADTLVAVERLRDSITNLQGKKI